MTPVDTWFHGIVGPNELRVFREADPRAPNDRRAIVTSWRRLLTFSDAQVTKASLKGLEGVRILRLRSLFACTFSPFFGIGVCLFSIFSR